MTDVQRKSSIRKFSIDSVGERIRKYSQVFEDEQEGTIERIKDVKEQIGGFPIEIKPK